MTVGKLQGEREQTSSYLARAQSGLTGMEIYCSASTLNGILTAVASCRAAAQIEHEMFVAD